MEKWVISYHNRMNYLLLIAGFAALIKGADWLVDGAVNVAKRAGLSEMLIGLTIVSDGYIHARTYD